MIEKQKNKKRYKEKREKNKNKKRYNIKENEREK